VANIYRTCSGITKKGRCGSFTVLFKPGRCKLCGYNFCVDHQISVPLSVADALSIHPNHAGIYCPQCFKKLLMKMKGKKSKGKCNG